MKTEQTCGCKYDGPVQIVSCADHNAAAKNLNRAQAMLIKLEMEKQQLMDERGRLAESALTLAKELEATKLQNQLLLDRHTVLINERNTANLQIGDIREKCARIAEGFRTEDGRMTYRDALCQNIAEAIRSANFTQNPKCGHPQESRQHITDNDSTCLDCGQFLQGSPKR